VIILDTLLVGGLKFVLGKIAAAVEAELDDDTVWREELLAAQMRLELGEITEREFARIERELLRRIREIRERRQGRAEPPGTFRVTGVEASVGGDDRFDEGRDRGAPAR
jgi:Gas vesicle protein G